MLCPSPGAQRVVVYSEDDLGEAVDLVRVALAGLKMTSSTPMAANESTNGSTTALPLPGCRNGLRRDAMRVLARLPELLPNAPLDANTPEVHIDLGW
jgi:hypothetical protein